MKKDTISRSDIAKLCNVSTSRVSQWAAEGLLVVEGKGQYPARENLERLVQHFANRDSLAELKAERLRKQNELLDTEIAKAKASTLDYAEVEKGWVNLVLLVRGRLLQLPSKIAPKLTFAMSEAEMERELQREIDDALTELAKPIDYGVKGEED